MTEQMTTGRESPEGTPGKAAAAKEVAGSATARAGNVAGEAQDQLKATARQAKDHVRDLIDRGRSDVGDEASVRSRQAAGSVRTLAERVGALANGNPEAAGPLADVLREGQDRLQAFAGRLDDGPSAVLDDVRRFARRQPVLFLASAGAIGFLAGRLVRAGRESAQSSEVTYASLPQDRPMGDLGVPAPGGFEPPTNVAVPAAPLVSGTSPGVVP